MRNDRIISGPDFRSRLLSKCPELNKDRLRLLSMRYLRLTSAEILEAVVRNRVDYISFRNEDTQCEAFAIYLHSDVKKERSLNKELTGDDRIMLAFGDATGWIMDPLLGRGVDTLNIADTIDKGLILIYPQTTTFKPFDLDIFSPFYADFR